MKELITISLKGIKTSLSENLFTLLLVYKDFEIFLLCLQTYSTFPNINSINNKMQILIRNDTEFDIIIDPGCYEIKDIKNK